MATVNIIFSDAGMADDSGGLPVYRGFFDSVETMTSSATSQATSITAVRNTVARIKVIGGDIYVSAPSDSPEAVVQECWLMGDGDVLDLGHLAQGDKIAIIDA